jgi:beta-galactosidase/beta-glucuronidase
MNILNQIPRPEYPRPQLVRNHWINLNGHWDFEFDFGKSGRDRELFEKSTFSNKILVPFCPESKLSGIEYKDFMAAVWYKRSFDIPEDWKGLRTFIHFGAVDYETEVWINGISAGKHRGGYSSFSFEITSLLKAGENTVVVCSEDDTRSGLQPRGKQCGNFYSQGCDYTRTTGIWQTVWLEAVPATFISELKITPDLNNAAFLVEGRIDGSSRSGKITIEAEFDASPVGQVSVNTSGSNFTALLSLSQVHPWDVNTPNLYDIEICLEAEDGSKDLIKSYSGLRSISLYKDAVLLNGKPVFQRLVLDQGFYPEGVYTAPSDEDLKNDILLSQAMGFNGARLHQKVFEERFLYWADKLGYLVWGEQGNWGLNITNSKGLERFLPEWIEVVERDYNHPSIVGWCPFNETWDLNGTRQDDEVLRIVYNTTKAIDKSRPVIDTSGNFHVVTDIFDVHDYDQNPESFKQRYEGLKNGEEVYVSFPDRQKYEGQPYFVSEYGGIWWNPEQKDQKSWGYGSRPRTEEEFLNRYKGLTEALLQHPKMCAFCYTQLTDVEQEVNGLYTFDRKPKFDPEIIKAINSQKAAIEE